MAKHEKKGQFGQDLPKQHGQEKHASKENQSKWHEKQGKHNGISKTSHESHIGSEEEKESKKSSKY